MCMATDLLEPTEVCGYFESLPAARQQLVWVRCRRLLNTPIEEIDDSEQLDEAFDQVLTEMWCSDQLERLTELGRLQRDVSADGEFIYSSCR